MKEIKTRISNDSLKRARIKNVGTIVDSDSEELVCSGTVQIPGLEDGSQLGISLLLKFRNTSVWGVVEGKVLGNAAKSAVPFLISTKNYRSNWKNIIVAEILVYELCPQEQDKTQRETIIYHPSNKLGAVL